MKTIITVMMMINSLSIIAQDNTSFYNIKVKTIDGKEFDFNTLKGKKVLIVNTASKCGFTPQYEALEKVYKAYGGDKFVILGFPANNFMKQEPGTNEEIANFCKINYGVSFPMMSKISVKGDSIHPLYQWLTQKKLNGILDSEVKWNFQKYFIDEHGKLISVFYSSTKPDDKEIISLIVK
jgi:glutathione peroxidase